MTNCKDYYTKHDTPILLPNQIRCLVHWVSMSLKQLLNYVIVIATLDIIISVVYYLKLYRCYISIVLM